MSSRTVTTAASMVLNEDLRAKRAFTMQTYGIPIGVSTVFEGETGDSKRSAMRNTNGMLADLQSWGRRTLQQRDLSAAAVYPDPALIREQQRSMFQDDSGDPALTGQTGAVRKDPSSFYH